MKRILIPVVALGAVLSSATVAIAQTSAAPNLLANEQPAKLMKVATITGASAVREFQQNVQLLQTQRQTAVDLNTQIQAEKDPKKKKDLQEQLDKLLKVLNENNAKMVKAYGFSLNHNYQMEIESANIYVVLSPDEAAAIEKEQKAKQSGKK